MQYTHGGDIWSCPAPVLDFSANLNPLGMPPQVKQAAEAAITDAIHYPDPACRKLTAGIAARDGVKPEQVLCGAGAADLIFRLVWAEKPRRAMVTAPTGDPAYFFSSCCLDDSPANNGGYHNDPLEALARQLDATFDPAQRGELAGEMQQILLDDDAYVFCSHLQMNLIARAGVTGLTAHPCDYYEITAELDVE